jgi:hypothetical protein
MSFLVNPYLFAPSCADADAVAFLAAAGITDATITSAICTLVTTMKADGTWAKCNAIYPMVGGTATTHKFNLKNPLDTNAAFRLTFTGGWTHSANGALPNGTNAYADTFLIPSTILNLNSVHISYYSRTIDSSLTYDIGAAVNPSAYLTLHARASNVYRVMLNTGTVYDIANLNGTGLFIANRPSSTLINGFRNSTKTHANLARNSIAQPNISINVGGLNLIPRIASTYGSKQCAFATIGSGLTDGEALTLYNSIQAFQTTLSRQV